VVVGVYRGVTGGGACSGLGLVLFFVPAGGFLFEAGFRPGGRPPFLWFVTGTPAEEKEAKERRPGCPRPLRFAAGQPASGHLRGSLRNSLRSLRELRSDNRSESDHEAVLSFGRTATPQAARRRRW